MLEIPGYGEVGDSDDQHRDMRMDIDHMSYEVKKLAVQHGLTLTYIVLFPIITSRHLIMWCHLNIISQELLALGDQIGSVTTGFSEEAVISHLKTRLFTFPTTSSSSECAECLDQETDFCVICQVLPQSFTSPLQVMNIWLIFWSLSQCDGFNFLHIHLVP